MIERKPQPLVPPIDPAEEKRRARDYAIYPIVRHGMVSLIGGADDCGKHMLFTQMISKWSKEQQTFGFNNYPTPFVVVCLLESEQNFRHYAAKAGLENGDLNILCLPDAESTSFADICKQARKLEPKCRVLWMDCIHKLLPSNSSVTAYGPVSRLMHSIRKALYDTKMTLIAGGSQSKPKQYYVRPIDAFLGSNAWTESCSSFIGLERLDADSRDNKRRLSIISRDYQLFINRFLQVAPTGMLVESQDELSREDQMQDNMGRLLLVLMAHPEGTVFDRAYIIELGESLDISRATCDRYIAILREDNKIQSAGYGKYTLVREQ